MAAPYQPAATILVVDDDRGLLRLLQKALEREGFTVKTAFSGKEATSWLGSNRPDLMLLDLKLQDLGGKELVQHLAGINRVVPFIVITGQGDERAAVDMMKRGALDYVVKDADFLGFVPEVVRQALDRLAKDKRLLEMEAALRESEEQVLEISEREQRRIGQDLHDGLGQQLTAIELMCQAVKSNAGVGLSPRELQTQLERVCRHIREAIAQTRALAHGLAAFKVESGGLEIALTELAQSTHSPGRMRCLFKCTTPVQVEETRVATHLYRIAQEAVNNALKHSQGSEITIELSRQKARLRLEVSDNGKGFPQKPPSARGLGLGVMRHRAGVIGAELAVDSKPGKGVTVTCALPAHN